MTNDRSIVIAGGGHAGVESALAISRLGVPVVLVTMDRGSIGRMSCNPAIGGLGKGHLVKEIDAFDNKLYLPYEDTHVYFDKESSDLIVMTNSKYNKQIYYDKN